MALMNPAILTAGKFGIGHFARQGITAGKAVARLGDEWYLVYRDDAAGTYDDMFPVDTADEGDATIVISGQDLDAAVGELKTWRYKIRGVSPGGTIGEASGETPITVDEDGAIYHVAGNDPTNLTLTLTTGGACILRWRYSEEDQPARPTGFKIYRLIAGTYTYADSVAFVPGITKYDWTSGTFANGTALDYTVRSYRTVSAVDYEQLTNDSVTGTSDAVGPAAPTSLTVTT